jgi:hypothetical protein
MEPQARKIHILVKRPEEFKSSKAAIASAKAANEAFLRHFNIAAIVDLVIESVEYGDQFLLCNISSGNKLLILAETTCGLSTVDVRLERRVPDLLRSSGAVELLTDNNLRPWDRDAVARSLVGKMITRVFYANNMFYLYPDELPAISFECLFDSETDNAFLYWDWSE